MSASQSSVVVSKVSHQYDQGSICALSDITLSLNGAEKVAITGPSGCGKSTLLHIISGLAKPTSGVVSINGMTPRSQAEWTALRCHKIGIVFQAFHLIPTLTAVENIELSMFGVVKKSSQRLSRAMKLLDHVGLSGRAQNRPNELSGGECQRVAIARSLANNPSLIIADEPTGNLDSKSAQSVISLLEGVSLENSATLIVATHDQAFAERMDRRIHIIDGRIVI